MGNNTFTECDRDIFYAIDTEGEPSIDTKFSTPITLVYNDFIHDGESVDPVYGKEVEGTDPIGNDVSDRS